MDDDELDELEAPMEEAAERCGEMPDGTCALAGSEYCDFECPFRDED